MRLFSRFQKNPKPELPHQAHPWQGERAHARQIEFLISRAQPITRQQFLGLPPDAAAVLDGFNQMVVEVARTRNRVGLMRAFAFAHSHVTERKKANYLAFMSAEQEQTLREDQRKVFESEMRKLFAVKEICDINGSLGVSTRSGGTGWVFGQFWRVLWNLQTSSVSITQKEGDQEVTSISRVGLHIESGLFDDYVVVTQKGIGISNPDSGKDFFWIEWAESGSLTISTNAVFLADPVNGLLRPFSKKLAYSQWVPSGTLTITDRQSGNSLVTALMPWPQKFQQKLEVLRSKMLPVAVPKKADVVHKAPLELDDFIGALPSALHEEMRDLLMQDGRSAWRRFSHKVGLNWKTKLTVADWKKNPVIHQLYVFQGRQFADENAMAESINNALKQIVREPDPVTRKTQLRALQELARRMRPHVDKLVQMAIDRVLKIDFK